MNREIYDNVISMMPTKIVMPTGHIVGDIAHVADAEIHNLCAGLVSAVMVKDTASAAVVHWARDQMYCSSLLLNTPESELFLELNNLAMQFQDRFEEYKLYVDDIVPYQCEAVMEDGSLLLSRVDSFEDFTRIADMRRKEDHHEVANEATELPY